MHRGVSAFSSPVFIHFFFNEYPNNPPPHASLALFITHKDSNKQTNREK